MEGAGKSMRALIMFASHHRLAVRLPGPRRLPVRHKTQVPLVLAPGGHTHNSNLNHISTCSDRSVPESGLCCSLISASPCRSYSTPILSRYLNRIFNLSRGLFPQDWILPCTVLPRVVSCIFPRGGIYIWICTLGGILIPNALISNCGVDLNPKTGKGEGSRDVG